MVGGSSRREEWESRTGRRQQKGHTDRKRSKQWPKGRGYSICMPCPRCNHAFTLMFSLPSNFHPATTCYLNLPHGDVPHFMLRTTSTLLYDVVAPDLALFGVLIPLTSPVCGIAPWPCHLPSPSLALHLPMVMPRPPLSVVLSHYYTPLPSSMALHLGNAICLPYGTMAMF